MTSQQSTQSVANRTRAKKKDGAVQVVDIQLVSTEEHTLEDNVGLTISMSGSESESFRSSEEEEEEEEERRSPVPGGYEEEVAVSGRIHTRLLDGGVFRGRITQGDEQKCSVP